MLFENHARVEQFDAFGIVYLAFRKKMTARITKLNLRYLFESLIRRRTEIRQETKHAKEEQNIPTTVKDVELVSLQAPTAPTALSLMQITMRLPHLFPRSFSKSYDDYKVFNSNQEKIQDDLLSTLPVSPYLTNSDKVAELLKIPIDDQGNYINELCIQPKSPKKLLKHLIFIHGYGAGLGFFLKNFENIPLIDDSWSIHAIDLPGFGFSSRPKFPFKYPDASPNDVNNWFHQRLQKWFEKRSLLERPQDNIVVAHSLGAYLMALYSHNFPNHFKKIIMCSPAGVCQSDNIFKEEMNKNLENHKTIKPPWWYIKLWERNISPFSLVRNTSVLGSKLTSGWSYRRFNKLLSTENDKPLSKKQFEMLHRYSYAIFNRPGSGEYLLAFALSCGGDPRNALEGTLFNQMVRNESHEPSCDWLWVYGENDWMNKSGGKRISEKLNGILGKDKSKFLTVPSAGHHLYFDNYTYFNEIIIKEMKKMMK